MTLPKVELHQAFVWTCEACGRDNFARGITLTPESIDADDMDDETRLWIECGGEGVFMTAPSEVECGHCGERFETEEP